jgi:hypothetical protein|nr:MAG TPA: hypothetical protein [Caudoviricetes sp.]
MLNINQLMTSSESNIIKETSRSPFYESASLVVSEKSLNLDYNEYQLKNFINSRTSGEGFKEAVKGGLQKIWKFIKGIIDLIVKGFNDFWVKLKSIFTRKKKDGKKEDTKVDDSVAKKEAAEKEAAEYKKKVEELNKELEKTLDEKEDLQDQIKNIQKKNSHDKLKLVLDVEGKKKMLKYLEDKILQLTITNDANKRTIKQLNDEIDNRNENIKYAERRYTKLENEHAEEYGELKAARMLKDFNYVIRHIITLSITVDNRFSDVLGDKERFNDKEYMEKNAIDDLKSRIDYDSSKRGNTIDTGGSVRNDISIDEIIESLNTRIERLNINEIKDALAKGYDINNIEKRKGQFKRTPFFKIEELIQEMVIANRNIKKIQKKVDNIFKTLSADSATDKGLLQLQIDYVKALLNYINGIYKITKMAQHKLLNFLIVVEPYVPEEAKIKLSNIRP